MTWPWFEAWLDTAPLPEIGAALFACMCLAAFAGYALRGRTGPEAPSASDQAQQGYIVSSVMALLALLLSFTFGMSVERYVARRQLVLEEANAIGTIYLRAQLLGPPHRERISRLLVEYTDNRIALAEARPGTTATLLATNDRLVSDLWAATSAAFDSIRELPFSTSFVEGMNTVIDLDSARKAARLAHVPSAVFVVLFVYLVGTAGVLGHVLTGTLGRLSSGFLMALFILSLLLVIDIDRPTVGGVLESQQPMLALRKSLAEQPPQTFDRWRQPWLVRRSATTATFGPTAARSKPTRP